MPEDKYGGIRLRLHFGQHHIVGPGRVELLTRIAETGSIAAAGRAMKMSYKRAWTMIEELNAIFDEPLVVVSRGGSAHGGARLTDLGEEVVRRYTAMLSRTQAVIEADFVALKAHLPQQNPEAERE